MRKQYGAAYASVSHAQCPALCPFLGLCIYHSSPLVNWKYDKVWATARLYSLFLFLFVFVFGFNILFCLLFLLILPSQHIPPEASVLPHHRFTWSENTIAYLNDPRNWLFCSQLGPLLLVWSFLKCFGIIFFFLISLGIEPC